MKARRLLSLIMALIMVVSFSAFVFAEAGDDGESADKFTVVGYYDDGAEETVSVKLNGQEISFELTDAPQFEPNTALSVEIVLTEGYTLGDDIGFVDAGIWIYWYGETSDVDDIEGLGVRSSDVEFVDGQKNVIRATINTPSADALEEEQYIALCFASYEEGYDPNEGRIDNVVINAPIIKAGEGYTVRFSEEDEYIIQDPAPNVTVPSGANYEIVTYDGSPTAYWLESEGGPEPYDYSVSMDDTTFETGEWYYIGVEIYPLRTIDRDIYFDADEDYWPEVEVKNGELVTYTIYEGYQGEYYTNYLVAVIRVTPQKDSPNTGEMNPLPYMAGIILSLSLAITIIDDDRRRYAKR